MIASIYIIAKHLLDHVAIASVVRHLVRSESISYARHSSVNPNVHVVFVSTDGTALVQRREYRQVAST